MILIHGECGSGKSAALRALESAPPAGFRAAYVPVPTLDFSGLARWCLDRLGIDAAQDPIVALRAAAKRMRLVLLIDDADRLPLDAALAARHLERDSGGAVALVAACGSDELENPSIVALGAAGTAIAVALGKSEEAAAAVRDRLSPARAPAAPPAPLASALLARREPAPVSPRAPRAAAAEPIPRRSDPAPTAATAPAVAPPRSAPAAALLEQAALPPPVSANAAPRTVPLSLAVAMTFAAFAIPAAFITGFLLGGTRGEAPASAPVAVETTALPEVAAAPPVAERVAPAPRAEPIAATPLPEAARAAQPVVSASPAPERRAPVAMRAPPAQREAPRAPAQIAERAPAAAVAAPPVVPPPRERRPPPRSESTVTEAWGAPALISVEPGSAAR